jgi:ribosomal protein L14E/L6E/L27E
MTESVRVIRSGAGRDKDTLLAVVGEEDGYVLTADGKRRSLSSPKRKNPRHIIPTELTLPPEALRSDRALRRALRVLRE